MVVKSNEGYEISITSWGFCFVLVWFFDFWGCLFVFLSWPLVLKMSALRKLIT